MSANRIRAQPAPSKSITYAKLRDAEEAHTTYRVYEYGLFAKDLPPPEITDGQRRIRPEAKRFFCAGWERFYNLLFKAWSSGRWVYEVMRSDYPCRMYFDIEVGVPTDGSTLVFEADRLSWLADLVVGMLDEFFEREFDRKVCLMVSQSCTRLKFSIHVVVRVVIIDGSTTTDFYLAENAQAFIENRMQNMLSEDIDDWKRVYLDRTMDHGLIDTSVYSCRRSFRMLGNAKVGKEVYLFPYTKAEGIVFRPDAYKLSYDEWRGHSITGCGTVPIDEIVSVVPGPYSNVGSKSTAPIVDGRVVVRQEFLDACDELLHESKEAVPEVVTTSRKRNVPRYTKRSDTVRNIVGKGEWKSFVRLDSDRHIFNGEGELVGADSIEDGGLYFCPSCETKTNKEGAHKYEQWVPVRPIGTESSAVGFVGENVKMFPEPQQGVCCFNCKVTTFVVRVANHEGINLDQCNAIPREGYLTPETSGMMDPNPEVFIDAPMGKGKTKSMGAYLNDPTRKDTMQRVVVISFRVALCEYLQADINSACDVDCPDTPFQLYSRQHFWADWVKTIEAKGCGRPTRAVICAQSLRNIPIGELEHGFDVVVIDECLFTMNQFVSEQCSVELQVENMRALGMLLSRSKKNIYMQHRITQECISFYQSVGKFSEPAVYKMDSPVSLMPVRYLDCKRLEPMVMEMFPY